MENKIVNAKLLAIRNGTYTMYVFQDLQSMNYIMCTKLPNWQVPPINIGDTGFLEYQIVLAGESYYDLAQDKTTKYLYSNVYFNNFIQKTDILNENNNIIL